MKSCFCSIKFFEQRVPIKLVPVQIFFSTGTLIQIRPQTWILRTRHFLFFVEKLPGQSHFCTMTRRTANMVSMSKIYEKPFGNESVLFRIMYLVF